jgi:sRNA-binding regulator protein Hfq
MARRDRVEALMARHGLNRALATQVELGQASLEGIMARRHIEEEFTRTRDKSVYDEAVANKREYTFGLHEHRTLRAIVTANEQYEFVYVNAETKEPGREHKLQVKYAFPAEDYKKIRKGMDFDDTRKKRAVQPIPRPQDRYACSDKRLGHAFHAQQHIAATTLEGERFTGEIAWVSRFEIGVRIKGDREVVVFRHALDLLEEVGKHEKK